MKIIFLDLDGVVNSHEFWGRRGKRAPDMDWWTHQFDEAAIQLINLIVEKTGAKIVISSTWRILNTLPELRHMLSFKGLVADIIDVTPRGHQSEDGRIYRGGEIQTWMDVQFEEIESFVIIDDDSDMLHLAPYHVKTSMTTGITMTEVERAIEMLNVGI